MQGAHVVVEGVGEAARALGFRAHAQMLSDAALPGQGAREQAQQLVRFAHRVLVAVERLVANVIAHCLAVHATLLSRDSRTVWMKKRWCTSSDRLCAVSCASASSEASRALA